MNNALISKILTEKNRAESKYPAFAARFICDCPDHSAMIQSALRGARKQSDAEKGHGYSVEATLLEEVFEVLEAASNKDWDACMMELAQVGSVVLRAMEWVQTNKLNKEPNDA